MTVKISGFAVVLILTYVSVGESLDQPSALTMSMPYMPYYPTECPTFNEFKKSVYTMNQALINIISSASNAYNYYSLYKHQPGPNLEIQETNDKFEIAVDYLEKKLIDYRQALTNFRKSIEYKTNIPILSMDDDIPIDRDLL
uniref:Mp1-like effector n=1 Tax=Myzus cerasi TaxID=93721 RepID=A0A1S6EKL8_9HEMI|nr:Mp1-like effector [Myzus cerasi]